MTDEKALNGRAVTFPDGREVALYQLEGGSFGLRFMNKEGDVTSIALSKEAMNALLYLHSSMTWQLWGVDGTVTADQPTATVPEVQK